MMYLHALSPVHTGTGQGVDVIDLPVAREVTTNWPYLPGSSIKGVLRALCQPEGEREERRGTLWWQAFGPDTQDASEGAGALLFGDGRLLCLPVRSLFGTFVWVTCPLALSRYRRDHAAADVRYAPPAAAVPALAADQAAVAAAASETVHAGKVYLEDLDLTAVRAPLDALADFIARNVFGEEEEWRNLFVTHFAVVNDTAFTFLTETSMEVTARIRLQAETKTVADGALWYEEAIPAETIFSAPLLAQPRGGRRASQFFDVVRHELGSMVQIGGHASVGRGLLRVRLTEE
jgi:CRISPR-associated protein Cmr4